MSRILAIDYGKKRIGLALSDPLGITANPLSVLHRKSLSEDIKKIKSIIEEKEVGKVVLGLPLNMDGTPGILTEEIKSFAKKIEKEVNIDVEFHDERLTTHEAENLLIEEANMSREKRKKIKDKIAACLILKSYLESYK
ncbi:MAG: Holliday junction resolvase RuvX [Endomicrobiales bacterium]|nr:Holliday junction resolvase RuvX [Endomicrobiales bacterium]